MRISFSSLETFQNCPKKYQFQEIERIKAPKTPETAFGGLVHSALRYLHSKEPVFPSQEEFLSFYKENWPNKEIANWKDEYQEQMFFAQGLEILSRYYNSLDLTQAKVVDLETRFEVPLQRGNEMHIVTGKIDRIDRIGNNAYEIIDYKTNKRMPSQEEVENNMQLAIYHMGLQKRWPHVSPENIKLSLYFLKHGEKLSTHRSQAQLSQTVENLFVIMDEIKHSDFKPKVGPLCDYCAYKEICPSWKNLYSKGDSPAELDIQKSVNDFLKIKKEISERQEKLSGLQQEILDYCKKNDADRLFGEDGAVIQSWISKYDFDEIQVKEILSGLGKWDQVLSIDSAKLKELMKSLPLPVRKKIDQSKKLVRQSPSLRVAFKKESGDISELESELF